MWTEAKLSEDTVIRRPDAQHTCIVAHLPGDMLSPNQKKREFFFSLAYIYLIQFSSNHARFRASCLHSYVYTSMFYLLGPMSSLFTHWADTDKINTAHDAGITLSHLTTGNPLIGSCCVSNYSRSVSPSARMRLPDPEVENHVQVCRVATIYLLYGQQVVNLYKNS